MVSSEREVLVTLYSVNNFNLVKYNYKFKVNNLIIINLNGNIHFLFPINLDI